MPESAAAGARREIDRALLESAELYRATFDNAGVGIAHVGLDGRWIRINDALCTITGYSREELSARTFEDITHPDDIEPDWALARRLAAGEIPSYSMEKRYLRKDRGIAWVNLTVSLLRDQRGIPQQYISVIEDISKRKRAEAALRESEERYRSLVSATSAIVWTADANGQFSRPQPSWQAYTGQSWEEYQGSGWIAAVHPEDRARLAEAWQAAVAGKSVYEIEWRAWHAPSRQWRHCLTRAVPILEHDGAVREWIAAVSDIHDRKLLETKLQHQDKVDSLGVLAGGVAHDFNNLLVGILGNAGLALEETGPKLRHLLQQVIRAAERAADLTRQMLAYAGKGQFIFEAVDLSNEVRDTVSLVRSSLHPSTLLQLELAENLPTIRADRGQIHQVILNLIINSGEALQEKGGNIRIATTVEPGGRRVSLTVEDDGMGMTDEIKARIFDPFFTTKFTGRGLGLAAVMGIVRAHNGVIELDTSPGRGATFRIWFPVSEPVAMQSPAISQDAAEEIGPLTVLVIDDEESVRNVARIALANAGAQTLLAASGGEGIEIFRSRTDEIDIVLLDVTMPDMGGREVLRAIRQLRPGTPVVASSGHSYGEVAKYFGDDAPSAFLAKPYKPAALITVVAANDLRPHEPE